MTVLDSPDNPVPATPTTSRAGRNLPVAIAVGLGLGALITAPLFSPYRWLFVVVLVGAMVVGTREVVHALRTLGVAPPLVPLVVGGATMIVLAYREGSEELFIALVLTVLACLV